MRNGFHQATKIESWEAVKKSGVYLNRRPVSLLLQLKMYVSPGLSIMPNWYLFCCFFAWLAIQFIYFVQEHRAGYETMCKSTGLREMEEFVEVMAEGE